MKSVLAYSPWVHSLGGEDPLEKEMATHSSIPAWRVPWNEECAGLSPWVHSPGREDPLEKEMATHSSIPAWRIRWNEERAGLQSMGSFPGSGRSPGEGNGNPLQCSCLETPVE